MTQFTAYSGRGGVFVWRQGEAAPASAGTGNQRLGFQVYGRHHVFVWPRRYGASGGGGGTSIDVPAGSLTLTGYAPTVSTPRSISVPLGTLTLTGYAPTVSISASIAIPAGSLTLTGYAPTVNTTLGTLVAVPAGSLTLTGYAPTVYTLGGTTTSTMYLPIRAYSAGSSQAVDPEADLNNLRSLLPSQRQAVVNTDGTMKADWYRFFDYLVNVFLGGPGSPTMSDVVAAIEAALAAQTTQAAQTALIAQQSQTNAEALAAVVQVAVDNSLTGADQIPRVSQTYLEP